MPFSGLERKIGIRAWLLALILVSALPAVIFAGVAAYHLVQGTRDALITDLQRRTEALTTTIDRRLQTAITTTSLLAESPLLAKGDLEAFHAHASQLIQQHAIAKFVVVIDKTGQQLLNTGVSFGTPLPRARANYQRVFAEDRPQISNLFTGTVAKSHIYSVGVPVRVGQDVPFILSLAFDPHDLVRVLNESQLPPGWIAGVIDRAGAIVARTEFADSHIGDKASPETLKNIAAADKGLYPADVAGRGPMTAAFERLGFSDWTMVMAAPQAQLEATARQATLYLFTLGGTLLAFGGLGAYLFARGVSHQMASVARAADALGHGAVLPPIKGGIAELDVIAQSLITAKTLIETRERERDQLVLDALHAKDEATTARAAAERASLARTKFVAAASHDLRQPVQSLVLLIEVLRRRIEDGPLRQLTERMDQAVNALQSLLNSILDISKLDAGVVVPEFASVALGPVLERLAEEYHLRATDQGLHLRLVSTSRTVRTDGLLLERVLRNLLENALRYTPAGKILIGCRRRGDMVRVDILDSGVGIAVDQLERIFDEFHQIANSERNHSQGLGLGLAIVRRQAHLLGSAIEVASIPGQGSRFSIALPLEDVATPAPAPAPVLPAAGSAGRRPVLVIEDDDNLRASLLLLLESWGYSVRGAACGDEALALVASGCRPHAVLADYRMPGTMNGVDTVLALAREMKRPLPGAILTGDTAPERLTEVHASGLSLLHKPVVPDELRRVLDELLEVV